MKKFIADVKSAKLSHTIVAVLTALIAVGLTVEVTPDHHVLVHVGPTTATKVDSSAAPGVQPATVTTSTTAAMQAQSSPELNQHGALRDESPPGVPSALLNQSQDLQEKLAHNDQLPIVQPDAAPSQRGCVSRFVVNYSSRRGVAPREWTLHFTVSHNVPGWSDVNAIVNLFNTPSDQASSNYVLDGEGHCAYIVRESDKAWTQAGGNPYSISVEVVDYGNEKYYLAPAGLKKLAMIISDSAARWHIPIQRGSVSGCVPVRSGIVQHKDWGQCGGGHFDISPFPVSQVINAVRAFRHQNAPKPCSKRTACKMGRRHAAIHTAIRNQCGHSKSVPCQKLRARNDYIHRYAAKHHLKLVTK